MQAFTPQLVLNPLKQSPPNKYVEILWGYFNCVPPMLLGLLVLVVPFFQDKERDQTGPMTGVMVAGIAFFAILFAINSSIHSYLVVRYAEGNKVAQSVGFYYMANAGGRLLGTVLSGWTYTQLGLVGCLWASTAMLATATVLSVFLRELKAETAAH